MRGSSGAGHDDGEPIVLECGGTHDTALEDCANLLWTQDGKMSLTKFRKDIRTELQDEQGTTVMMQTQTRK